MNSMKRQNEKILKEELPRSVGVQIATGDQWRNNSRKNEGMEPKQKQYPAVDHILSDLSTLIRHPGWPHTAWLSFIELDKAVVHDGEV